MFSEGMRAAILELHKRGHSIHSIKRTLGASRFSIRRILKSGKAQVPTIVRANKAESYRAQIVDLYSRCRGNLKRVYEGLRAQGTQLSYSAPPCQQ
jgi:hypothetical protein